MSGDGLRFHKMAKRNSYDLAVDYELVLAHLGVTDRNDSPDEALRKLRLLIDWHVSVALDPKVNGGFVLVPYKNTTAEMRDAGSKESEGHCSPGMCDEIYMAMIENYLKTTEANKSYDKP